MSNVTRSGESPMFWVAMHGPNMAYASAMVGYKRDLRRDVGPDAELRKVDGAEMQRLMTNYQTLWQSAHQHRNWSA